MGEEPCENRPIILNYLDIDPVVIGGGHNDMLSHVCMGKRDGLCRINIDVHRYPVGGMSNFNVHPIQEQVYFVLEGEGEVSVAGDRQRVCPGSLVFIPRHALHAIRNLGETELVLAFLSVVLDPEAGT
jgi:mannose-6-phosphate isomerase-like protein (cupin superfamily)